jgi:hypothetical protein
VLAGSDPVRVVRRPPHDVYVEVRKPVWSDASCLLYVGAFTVLAAAASALAYLTDRFGDAAYVGWVLLVLVVLAGIATTFQVRGRWMAAGLFAVSTVVTFAIFLAALEQWWGWLPDDRRGPFTGFNVPVLLIELLTLLAALSAMQAFRFPLLTALAAAAAWYFVTDLVSGGGNWSAVVTFLVGLVFLGTALGFDHSTGKPYGFWMHVAAGLTIGGSLLFFWHESDWHWALIAVAGLVYIAFGAGLDRSSWAVLGTVGLFLSATHWAQKWSGGFFDIFDNGPTRDWAPFVVFAILGFLLVLLGLGLERKRRVTA